VGKHEKKLREWSERPPKEVLLRELLSVARHFGIPIQLKKSGHYVLIHGRLTQFQNSKYAAGCGNLDIRNNRYAVPTCHGRYVKERYVKTIARFIQFLEEREQ